MLDKVKETIKEYNMINEGETVLCCLSGGADSVTLVLCLRELGFDIRACHVNHNLRGAESDRDERFCRELCERLHIPLDVLSADVTGYCREHGCSVEEGARRIRYEFFETLGADKIATAHTLSDSLETALFNLARGTGAKGLCGIPPVRGSIIRPLIACTRDEIEAFLVSRGQDYVTDSTNLSDDYSRNSIRHSVVPVLKGLNPAAEQSFYRLSRSLAEDNALIEAQANELLRAAKKKDGYDKTILAAAHDAILKRGLIALLKKASLPYDEARLTELCRIVREGGRLCLSGDVYAVSSGGLFRITELSASEELFCTVRGSGSFELGGQIVTVEIIKKSQLDNKVHDLFTYIALDYDKIKGELLVRTRRAGDSIRLAGRGCTKSLKKLFNEEIPLEKRGSVLLLCDSEGVLAVPGFGAAERAACSEETENVLIFSISSNCHNSVL